MSKKKFTTEASLLWGGIPLAQQKRILKSACCTKCDPLAEIAPTLDDSALRLQ